MIGWGDRQTLALSLSKFRINVGLNGEKFLRDNRRSLVLLGLLAPNFTGNLTDEAPSRMPTKAGDCRQNAIPRVASGCRPRQGSCPEASQRIWRLC
jgi:hypothetical protein